MGATTTAAARPARGRNVARHAAIGLVKTGAGTAAGVGGNHGGRYYRTGFQSDLLEFSSFVGSYFCLLLYAQRA